MRSDPYPPIAMHPASNDHPAIVVENLGKLYRIGRQRARYQTLREAVMEGLTYPLRQVRFAFGPRTDSAPRTARDTVWALRDVSFRVRRGDVVGIVGRNGAGKTTLLKVLSRITEPTRGRAVLRGRVGSLLEVGTGFHPELTGRENIFLNGAILGMTRREIKRKFNEIVEFAEVEKFIDTPVKRYSSGMSTRLAFAVAAHLEPEILAVDEVLAVGDLGFRKKCLGKMEDVSHQGRTVLFVSHDMNTVRRLCRTGIWLDEGRVRALGDARDVVRQYEAFVLGGDGGRRCEVERADPPASQKYFSRVALSSPGGDGATVFRYGEGLRLTVGMCGRVPHRTHFVEWFLDDRSRGNRVAWGGTHALPEGDVSGDCGEVSFLIGPLPLAEGTYSISLAMGVPGVVDLDFWRDAIAFEVTDSDPAGCGYHYSTRYAPVVIPYRLEAPRGGPG